MIQTKEQRTLNDIKQAKEFFFNLHDVERNQKYNKTLPYSFHLDMVGKQAEKWLHMLHPDYLYTKKRIVMIGAYGHDVLEGDGFTYSDIKQEYGEEIAEVIFLCTELRGRTRAERHAPEFWKELATNELAVYVKLCDIMANAKFSLLSNSSMYNKYKEEYQKYVNLYYTPTLTGMFIHLEKILSVDGEPINIIKPV